jgi:hypothetical protein
VSADAAVTFDIRLPFGAAVAILRCRDGVGMGNGFWPAAAPPREGNGFWPAAASPREGAAAPPVGGEAELDGDGAAAGGRVVGDGAEPATGCTRCGERRVGDIGFAAEGGRRANLYCNFYYKYIHMNLR